MENKAIANEEGIIGAVLEKPEIFSELSDILKPESFSLEQYRWVWEAFFELHENKQRIDVITVADELSRKNRLDQFSTAKNSVFGQWALASIRKVGDPRSAMTYAANIADYHAKRQLQDLAGDVATWANNGRKANDILADMQQIASGITTIDSKATEHTSSLSDALAVARLRTEAAMRGEIVAVPTGLEDLDRALGGGFFSPDFIIVGGRPGTGKTALLTTISRNAAKNGKRVLFVSLEMENAQIATRLLVMESGIPFGKFRSGNLSEDDLELYKDAESKIQTYEKNIVLNDLPAITISMLRQEIRKAGKVDLVIFDYLQLGGVEKKKINRYLEIGELSRGLKGLCKEFALPIVAGAQLSRAVESRQNKRPLMSDLREGGDIENDADIILFLHKDDENNSEIIIGKHRNGGVGSIDTVFMPKKMQFLDAEKRHINFN